MSISCPRIIVAGTGSGVGKTSVTLALVSALRKRGLKVQTFKVGPDYLDPTYLERASGWPCYNLDGWMTGEAYVRQLFDDRARGADIAVIEGVMGLFDGSDPVKPDGSTAQIAVWLDAPVILVANVHGVARSLSALVYGYTRFDPQVRIVGVVANQCGSERHGYWLGQSLEAFGLPPVVAAPPRGAFPELPSRHLGLVTADERLLPRTVLERLGEALEQWGSVDSLIRMAREAPPMEIGRPQDASAPPTDVVRLGLAHDEAFHFYYPDNLEALEAQGCQLIRFSPVRDSRVPPEVDGLYIGGGYPEEYAEALSANRAMLQSLTDFADSGRPVYAECGGLMLLSQGIETTDGRRCEMVGLLPGWTRMLDRLRSLGYVEVTLQEESLFGRPGEKLRGHEFHYSVLTDDPCGDGKWTTVYRLRRMRSEESSREGFQHKLTLASYIHAHFASHPEAVEHFVSICRKSRR